jgi:hypothetical protein
VVTAVADEGVLFWPGQVERALTGGARHGASVDAPWVRLRPLPGVLSRGFQGSGTGPVRLGDTGPNSVGLL